MNETLRALLTKAAMTALIAVLGAGRLEAQTMYEKVQDLDLWTAGSNSAGMAVTTFGMGKVSFAELYGGLESGGLINPSDAASAIGYGLKAGTRVDFGKFLTRGTFGFSERQGKEMCGSMFSHPGEFPFDVYEFSPGGKTLQTYSFSGEVATNRSKQWIYGCGIDFESGNYAKRKDIRHTNYRLDLKVAPSLVRRFGGTSVGISGIFRKLYEDVKAEQIGTASADSYFAFLDKGLMFGSYQVWDGNGLHLKDQGVDRLAAKILSMGGGLQMMTTLAGRNLYADLEYSYDKGSQGERGYNYFSFPGSTLRASLGINGLASGRNVEDVLRLRFAHSDVTNNEKVIDKVTSGGITSPVTYGSNSIYARIKAEASAEYSLYGRGRLSWLEKLHAELFWNGTNEQAALTYPYCCISRTDVVGAGLSSLFAMGRYKVGADLSFRTGRRVETNADAAVPNGDSEGPYRLDDWKKLLDEWETAGKLGAGITFRRDFVLRGGGSLFVGLSGAVLQGFNIEYASGSSRLTCLLRAGYEF